MARSKAQKEADKRYRESHPGISVAWGTTLTQRDATALEEVRKRSGMGRADFLRWATSRLQRELDDETTGG